MPRKREVIKRSVNPDPKFNDKVVAKFVNCLMNNGKRSIAEGIFYSALEVVGNKTKDDGLKVFKKALDNVKPALEVRSRRVGGSTYQVPTEVRADRRQALAIRWLIQYSRARAEKSMSEKLAAEIIDASQNKGASVKKREDLHKMAEANKAFAHYRW